MTELLDYLREGPHTNEEILERFREDLGVTWETDAQVGFRLGWLENVGVAVLDGDSWVLCQEATLPETVSAPARAPTAAGLEEHFPGLPPSVISLFRALERRVLDLDGAPQRVFRKQYVAYRIGKHTICSVIPQKKRLRLVLPLNPLEIQHPLTRNISGIGHWGIGSLEVDYSSIDALEQIMAWVREAAASTR